MTHMGRRFDIVSTIGEHNKSYVIRPDKTIIKSLGWNFGNQVEIFPIPEKGILCIKGRKISKEKFKHNFEENYILNNKRTELRKILNKLKTLRNKSTPLDWIFEEGRKELIDLNKEIKRWDEKLNSYDKIMSDRQMGLDKAVNKINKKRRN